MFGRFFWSVMVAVVVMTFGDCRVFSQEDGQMNAAEVLRRYSESNSWLESVSMKIDIDGSSEGLADKGPFGVSVVFRRDGGRAEWIGRIFGYDENGNVDPNNNHTINEIFTGEQCFSFTNIVGGTLMGAVMSKESQEQLEGFMESPTNGGPLWGRIFGNNHKSVADLLAESADFRMLKEQENINGMACYVLEGSTQYGKATAWVAPERGYSALKWSIEKSSGELFDGAAFSADSWLAVFDSVELQDMNGVYVPVCGVFTLTNSYSDGGAYTVREEFRVSEVQLNPDFAGLGAFAVDLPDGTWVQVQEAMGIRYVWKGGKVVPAVDGPTFDEIDRMVESLK